MSELPAPITTDTTIADADEIIALWGRNIREARIRIGRPQSWLAKRLGVDQSLVSFWEHGRRAPTVEKQLALARVLGADGRTLFPLPEEVA